MVIRFNPPEGYLQRYLSEAPAALALERTAECELLSQQAFVRPVLDIGCGDGIFAAILFKDEIDLGIDINPVEIEHARKLGKYKELIACPGDRIPVPDGAFRTAFSNSVMEHIPDLPPVLAEANRVLAQGGTLYLTLPTHEFAYGSLVYRFLSLFGIRRLNDAFESFYNRFWNHFNFHSPADWQLLFERHGFTVEETRLYGSKPMCSINDGLAFGAVTSLLAKKLLNRWFFFPAWRRATAPIWRRVFAPVLAAERTRPGYGLVFFRLSKSGLPHSLDRQG